MHIIYSILYRLMVIVSLIGAVLLMVRSLFSKGKEEVAMLWYAIAFLLFGILICANIVGG